jgi:hypothetical protein
VTPFCRGGDTFWRELARHSAVRQRGEHVSAFAYFPASARPQTAHTRSSSAPCPTSSHPAIVPFLASGLGRHHPASRNSASWRWPVRAGTDMAAQTVAARGAFATVISPVAQTANLSASTVTACSS